MAETGGFGQVWPLLSAAIVGYLAGSIPFGLVLTKLAGLGDLRQIGSGNIGATNVLRTGNKGLAAATVLLDGAKGGAVALLGAWLTGSLAVGIFLGGFAFLGHLFPVWLGFKGGKGVATFLGVLLGLTWPIGILCCLTWLATAVVFRYSSLAALVAAAASPIYAWFLAGPEIAGLALAMTVLIFVRHHANISRLLAGDEPKIGQK